MCVKLTTRLGRFVEERGLGFVFDSSTGFRLPNGNVRLPDLSFVSKGRLDGGRVPDGFCPLAPDLAVEVLSPADRPRQIFDKVGEYLDAAVSLVWVIDPEARTAIAYRSLVSVRRFGPEDTLDGEDVVRGFHCPLAEIV